MTTYQEDLDVFKILVGPMKDLWSLRLQITIKLNGDEIRGVDGEVTTH